MDLRIASFNVENLFGRAKVFTESESFLAGDSILEKVEEFRKLLEEENYTDLRKQRMLALYNGEGLRDYIIIREDKGKLWKRSGWAIVGVKANGRGDWDGGIEFKRADWNDLARENTARVIKETRADVLCVVEAEDRPSLRAFDSHLMNSRYKYELLIDGNDSRGIDVGIYSKYEPTNIKTHMFDRKSGKQVFSRDCLEVEIDLDGTPLHILCNHFKSKGYDSDGQSDTKRKRQATRVNEILDDYRLTKEYVVVAGDLNDIPESDPLAPLLDTYALYDVMEVQFGNDMSQRWTYHWRSFEQIDYLLVSRPLKKAMVDAGVIRGGIAELHNLTSAPDAGVATETEYDTVTHWTNQASDHGAVWAEFSL